jgi:hypothetical protein
MRRIGFTAFMATFLMTSGENAGCIGSGSFQTCNDDSGNSYTINRYGNSTTMNGYNGAEGPSVQKSTLRNRISLG